MERSFIVEYRVLDKGFIRLIEKMGDDYSVVESARVSHGRGRTTPERDKKLIEYLMKHGHGTPFEHVVFKFHVKCPIFVARQWMRHRIASYNEISGRYTVYEDEWYVPDKPRIPDPKNKQGSRIVDDPNLKDRMTEIMENSMKLSYENYQRLLELGLARELSRIILPMAMYTQFYWTVNARSLMNFLNLRCDSHAQYEMREYAIRVARIFKSTCPWVFEAFLRYGYTGDMKDTLEALKEE